MSAILSCDALLINILSTLMKSVADLGGARGVRPPPRAPKFFQFHAVFGKIWQNHMLAPHQGSWCPQWGNPGSATGNVAIIDKFLYFLFAEHPGLLPPANEVDICLSVILSTGVQTPPPPPPQVSRHPRVGRPPPPDTVNRWVVRILLECIPVDYNFCPKF